MTFHVDQVPKSPGAMVTAGTAVAYAIVAATLGVLLVARWAIKLLPAHDYEAN